jgi:hypothetical protein
LLETRDVPSTSSVSLINPGNQTNYVGDYAMLGLSAGDSTGVMDTYSVTGLPPGLSVDSESGIITGTISSNAVSGSPYTVTATASDSTDSDSQTFTWTIYANPITLATTANQTNYATDHVSLQVSATYTGSLGGAAGSPWGTAALSSWSVACSSGIPPSVRIPMVAACTVSAT